MAWTRRGKMYEAIAKGDIATVTRLADAGFDVRSGGYGMQPILAATAHGRKDMVEMFIRKGANFVEFYRSDDITDGWQTLLHVAAARGHKDIVELLIENDKYDRTLINKRDGAQNTALHIAAAAGQTEVVKALLAAGFDPALTGANGKLAIGFANQGGHREIVELLQPRKAAPASIAAAAPAQEPQRQAASEKWQLASEDSVAQVCDMKTLGYRITEVFNFASRERIRIVNNLKTKADNVETTPFDSLPDRAQLEEAFSALKKLGGRADPK